jgi:hypothetical protein
MQFSYLVTSPIFIGAASGLAIGIFTKKPLCVAYGLGNGAIVQIATYIFGNAGFYGSLALVTFGLVFKAGELNEKYARIKEVAKGALGQSETADVKFF